ncbi:pleckstrin (PH) domain-containing protein [Tieghemostelium lacteum]|uniref:Pleckstrin (PH) domain-containing protein n=1 Tax=Tieghemostelium lacteum TaxID=361077 RepID=A0A151ZSF4_TIELA|nr:pleckstrin (PH) domain-containing protein [Tieghemostelium lacteum]|eukprot:KYQ96825.1 pleckstrin (PH) domain-containing protein [Tieghemostelium lacteum]
MNNKIQPPLIQRRRNSKGHIIPLPTPPIKKKEQESVHDTIYMNEIKSNSSENLLTKMDNNLQKNQPLVHNHSTGSVPETVSCQTPTTPSKRMSIKSRVNSLESIDTVSQNSNNSSPSHAKGIIADRIKFFLEKEYQHKERQSFYQNIKSTPPSSMTPTNTSSSISNINSLENSSSIRNVENLENLQNFATTEQNGEQLNLNDNILYSNSSSIQESVFPHPPESIPSNDECNNSISNELHSTTSSMEKSISNHSSLSIDSSISTISDNSTFEHTMKSNLHMLESTLTFDLPPPPPPVSTATLERSPTIKPVPPPKTYIKSSQHDIKKTTPILSSTNPQSSNSATEISIENPKEKYSATLSGNTVFAPVSAPTSSIESRKTKIQSELEALPSKQPTLSKQSSFTSQSNAPPSNNELKNVLDELLSTEEDYLRDLDFIVNQMVEPMTSRGFDKVILKGLFSNIEIIRNLCKTIITDMKASEVTLHNTVVVFTKMSAFFKMYSQYCTHHMKSIQLIDELSKNNQSFNQFKQELFNNPQSRGLKIQDYLIKPIQRICKYPLLFNQMLKSLDKSDKDYIGLQQVYDKLVEVAEFVNEFQKISEKNDRLLELQNQIDGAPFTILESTRKILSEVQIKMKEASKEDYHNRYMFIFNDLMVFCKLSTFSRKFNYSFQLSYQDLKVLPSIREKSILMSGQGHENESVNIEIQFETEQEKDTITNMIFDLLSENKKQYETMQFRTSRIKSPNANHQYPPKSKDDNQITNSRKYNLTDQLSPMYLFKSNDQIGNPTNHQAIANLSKIMLESNINDIKKKRDSINLQK